MNTVQYVQHMSTMNIMNTTKEMNKHRYQLERYTGMSTKHRCPECNKEKKFTRYIDTETNKFLDEKVGRCDRLDNCGYHYKPKQFFTDNPNYLDFNETRFYPTFKPQSPQIPSSPSFIPLDSFKEVLGKDLGSNNFVKFLVSLIGLDSAKSVIELYYLTTSNVWEGATIFWQIDKNKKIRSGKVMLYDSITGKREKTKNHWMHKVLNLSDFNLKQCFFGEHLLKVIDKIVAIVESDKTAVIMSHFLPQYIWLSTSGKEGLNEEKFKVLKGRTVILFPDLSKPDTKESCFELWSKKINEYKTIANISVSDYLERVSSEKQKIEGWDIADYYIAYHKESL